MIADTKTLAVGDTSPWIFSNVSVSGRSSTAIGMNGSTTMNDNTQLRISHEVTKTGNRRSLVSLSIPVPVKKTGANGSYDGTSSMVCNFTITRPDQVYLNSDELSQFVVNAVVKFIQTPEYYNAFFSGQA